MVTAKMEEKDTRKEKNIRCFRLDERANKRMKDSKGYQYRSQLIANDSHSKNFPLPPSPASPFTWSSSYLLLP